MHPEETILRDSRGRARLGTGTILAKGEILAKEEPTSQVEEQLQRLEEGLGEILSLIDKMRDKLRPITGDPTEKEPIRDDDIKLVPLAERIRGVVYSLNIALNTLDNTFHQIEL